LQICFYFFAKAMASNQATSLPPTPNPTRRMTSILFGGMLRRLHKFLGGGSWEWECNLCHQPYKGSYPRVKAHLLQELGKGVDSCKKTSDPKKREKYEKE
jgi:hypothetical protein